MIYAFLSSLLYVFIVCILLLAICYALIFWMLYCIYNNQKARTTKIQLEVDRYSTHTEEKIRESEVCHSNEGPTRQHEYDAIEWQTNRHSERPSTACTSNADQIYGINAMETRFTQIEEELVILEDRLTNAETENINNSTEMLQTKTILSGLRAEYVDMKHQIRTLQTNYDTIIDENIRLKYKVEHLLSLVEDQATRSGDHLHKSYELLKREVETMRSKFELSEPFPVTSEGRGIFSRPPSPPPMPAASGDSGECERQPPPPPMSGTSGYSGEFEGPPPPPPMLGSSGVGFSGPPPSLPTPATSGNSDVFKEPPSPPGLPGMTGDSSGLKESSPAPKCRRLVNLRNLQKFLTRKFSKVKRRKFNNTTGDS